MGGKINSVYFFCVPTGTPEAAMYQHNTVALAEGLQCLGIETFCNIDYWQNENGYLLKKSNIDFRDCDVIYVDAIFYTKDLTCLLPDNWLSTDRRYRIVFNDSADGFITPGFLPEIRDADIVLKSHYNSKYDYPQNFVPWQFGLTNRIVQQLQQQPHEAREKVLINNFRVNHPLRTLAEKKVAPIFRDYLTDNANVNGFDDVLGMQENDIRYWHQTGRRHYPEYYKKLSHAAACFCFGGTMQKSISNRKGLGWQFLKKIDWHLNLVKHDRICQYDSWRFWETLAAGCCAIHIDLEKYGCKLPIMPTNGVHYFGIDLNNISKAKKILKDNPEICLSIGNAGKEWVLENYTPLATAERLLAYFID